MTNAVSLDREVTIYGLVDPRNGFVRYIGKTVQRSCDRLAQHVYSRGLKRQTKCASWITSLNRQNLRPEAVELEVADESSWKDAEIFWIASFRLMGADLCNLADGGLGSSGYRLSEQHKEKIRRSSIGRIFSAEAKERLRSAKIGKARPDLAQRNKARARLPREAVIDIFHSQDTVVVLMQRYDISKSMVSFIRNGKRRADISRSISGESLWR